MAKKMISEAIIMKLIMDEFNKNSLGLEFVSSVWGQEDINNPSSPLLIIRKTFQNDRFDVKEVFNEETYYIKEITFVPMDVGNLNAEYLTHPEIQEIMFSPQIQFLVKSDDAVWVNGVREVLEEVRTNLMQKEVIYDISQLNFKTNSFDEVTYKGVYSTGTMDYGSEISINGKNYLMFSLEVNLFLTNFGEFANQEEFTFYSSEILDENDKPKPFNIPLLTWDYGTAVDTEPTQALLEYEADNSLKEEVVSYNKTKAFGLTFRLPISFKNEFLRKLYIYSKKRQLKIPTIYLEQRTYYYEKNDITKEYERLELVEARDRRSYTPTLSKPNEELSLGDKIDVILTLTPNVEEWFE